MTAMELSISLLGLKARVSVIGAGLYSLGKQQDGAEKIMALKTPTGSYTTENLTGLRLLPIALSDTIIAVLIVGTVKYPTFRFIMSYLLMETGASIHSGMFIGI